MPDYPTAPHHPGSPSYSPPRVEGREAVIADVERRQQNAASAFLIAPLMLRRLNGNVDNEVIAVLIDAMTEAASTIAADFARELDDVRALGVVPIAVWPEADQWQKWINDRKGE